MTLVAALGVAPRAGPTVVTWFSRTASLAGLTTTIALAMSNHLTAPSTVERHPLPPVVGWRGLSVASYPLLRSSPSRLSPGSSR